MRSKRWTSNGSLGAFIGQGHDGGFSYEAGELECQGPQSSVGVCQFIAQAAVPVAQGEYLAGQDLGF
jgi:hypothetical protein